MTVNVDVVFIHLIRIRFLSWFKVLAVSRLIRREELQAYGSAS